MMPVLTIYPYAWGYVQRNQQAPYEDTKFYYTTDDHRPPIGYDSYGKYIYRAALSFSLANLPIGATVTMVEFGYQVTLAGGASHIALFMPYNCDGKAFPCDDDATTMFNRIYCGSRIYLQSTNMRVLGSYIETLGSGADANACVDVQNAKKTDNRFTLGISEYQDNDTEAVIRVYPIYSWLRITYEIRYKQGHFRWYKNGWQDQDAILTGVVNGDALQFRACIHELLGVMRINLDIDVEFREVDGTWQTLGAQGATNKAWRWRDDPAKVEHDPIDQPRLSCTTDAGYIHENACVDFEWIDANAHYEIDIVLEPYNAVQGKTYEFAVIVEGKTLTKDDEVATLVRCTMFVPWGGSALPQLEMAKAILGL